MRSGAMSILTVLAALVVGGGFVALSPEGTVAMSLAAGTTKTCPDFPSQAAAQNYYRQHPVDGKNLDRDDDGVACEAYTKYADKTRDETPKDVVDPPPPVVPTTVTPPAPSTATADPIPVVTAAPNTDRPRSDTEK